MNNQNLEEFEEHQDLSIKPLATFGVLTDIQYADVEDGKSFDGKRNRYYRNSLNLVKEAVANWKNYEKLNQTKLKCIIQLGDLIDGKAKAINDSIPSMQRVMQELNKLFEGETNDSIDRPKLLHIWGNHEMYNFKRTELVDLELNTSKYLKQKESVQRKSNFFIYEITDKLCLICLDYYEFSAIGYEESDTMYKKALAYLMAHNKNKDLNSVDGLRGHAQRFSKFNGSLSDFQIEWLKNQLKLCKDNNKKVIICGHLPIHAQASDPMCKKIFQFYLIK
jgi:manganese-dependent ADP-ribose/CDP-alcohol diphosphatase